MNTLAYQANQITDPLMMTVIGGIALIVVGFVLYNAFAGDKKSGAPIRRLPRREHGLRAPRRQTADSGRF